MMKKIALIVVPFVLITIGVAAPSADAYCVSNGIRNSCPTK